MVRPADRAKLATRMVELRAVGPEFPFYGTFTLRDGRIRHALLEGHGALVRPGAARSVRPRGRRSSLIGTEPFEIRGVIAAEPGRRIGAFTLGPRVMIDHADLESTGLLAFGSRASPAAAARARRPPARSSSTSCATRSRTSSSASAGTGAREDQMGENLARAENYLSLVGLVVLILGGIGVSSVTRVFVQQKVRSIAILKCLGTTSPQMLAIYMTQVLLLGAAGSALGVALAAGVMAACPSFVGDLTAVMNVQFGLTSAAVAQGVAIGLLVSILFSLVPLLEVRLVKPSLLLRQDVPPAAGIDWLKWGVTGGRRGALVAVAAWQAGSLEVGLMLSGGFVATAFVLHLAGAGLVRAVQPLRYAVVRAAAGGAAHRAAGQPDARHPAGRRVSARSSSSACARLQANLLRDFARRPAPTPDMFLIDIQPDQRDGWRAFLDAPTATRRPPDHPDAARPRRRRARPRDGPRQLRAGEGPRRCRASTPSPIDRSSRRTRS